MPQRGEFDGKSGTSESAWFAGQRIRDAGADDRLECSEDALAVCLTDNSETEPDGYQIGRHRLQVGGQHAGQRDPGAGGHSADSGGMAYRVASFLEHRFPAIEKRIGPSSAAGGEKGRALSGRLERHLRGGTEGEPSPSQPCAPGPSLSRDAGEGLVVLMMMRGTRCVGAEFRIEGRLAASDLTAEHRHHLGNHVILANAQTLACDLQWQMPVAKVPGDAQQARPISGRDLDDRLGRCTHLDIPSTVEFEPVAVGEVLGAWQIEEKG